MKNITPFKKQRGVTMFICLIILILMTLISISTFLVSTNNLKSVANMQYRDESIAAGNKAIEQLISSPFTDAPAAETLFVDINNNGSNDYQINIDKPVCTEASIETLGGKSSITLSATMSTNSDWDTIWEINAVVNDLKTGTSVTVRSGVRVLLTQTQKNAVCP